MQYVFFLQITADFGLWREIGRDWEVVECRVWCKKGGFLSWIEAGLFVIWSILTTRKILTWFSHFSQIFDFDSGSCGTEFYDWLSYNRGIHGCSIFHLWLRNDDRTFCHHFQDSMTSLSPAIRSHTWKIVKFVTIMALIFFNFWENVWFENVCRITVYLFCFQTFWNYYSLY